MHALFATPLPMRIGTFFLGLWLDTSVNSGKLQHAREITAYGYNTNTANPQGNEKTGNVEDIKTLCLYLYTSYKKNDAKCTRRT